MTTTAHPIASAAPVRVPALPARPLALEAATIRRRDRWATAALAVVGLLGGVVTGLALQQVWPIGGSSTDIAYAVSVLAAVVGTYGILVLLVLIARLPALERALGQDRLVIAHKRIAPWATSLVALHVALVVAAYAGFTGTGVLAQLWSQVTTSPWILPATVGLLLLVVAGVSSWRRARRRLRHETWWTIHLYTYLAIALAFGHQVVTGGPFLTGWARALWIALYAAVFGAILWFRVAVPLWRSWRHGLRVAAVVRESPDVVSVVVRGRDLDRLGVAPGQFFNWRFLAPGLVYEAHAYSVSGLPRGDLMRITVKALGDASAALAEVPVGTRVLVEGPYGAITPGLARGSRAVLVAGGVGVAQVRSLAEAFAGRVRTDVIYRASTPADLALAGEFEGLGPGVRVHLLPGSRHDLPLDATHLSALVGDLRDADVFACGPAALNQRVASAARSLGVRPERIHWEEFDL